MSNDVAMAQHVERSEQRRSVVIAILTYQRPQLLTGLLDHLSRQIDQASRLSARFRVLVVDNDPEGSGRQGLGTATPGLELTYVVEPRRGIASARNRALDEASADQILIFIDDDEVPDDGWLRSLVQTYDASRPAAVAGPVRTEFLGEVDPWITAGGFIDRSHRAHLATGDLINEAATNNLLLDLEVVRSCALRFDESLGLGSGEDSLFTRQLTMAGHRMVWCADAWVSDLRPADRTTRKAALRRSYSFANLSARVRLKLAGTSRPRRAVVRCRLASDGVARMAMGGAMTLIGRLTSMTPWRARGARLTRKGAGLFTGALGIRSEEYGVVSQPAPGQE